MSNPSDADSPSTVYHDHPFFQGAARGDVLLLVDALVRYGPTLSRSELAERTGMSEWSLPRAIGLGQRLWIIEWDTFLDVTLRPNWKDAINRPDLAPAASASSATRAKKPKTEQHVTPKEPSPIMLAFHERRERAQELLGRAGVIGVTSAVYVPPMPPILWEQIAEQADAEGGVLAIDFEAQHPLLVVRLDVAEAWLGMGKKK